MQKFRDAVQGASPSLWWAAFFAHTLIIAFLCTTSVPPLPTFLPLLPHLDKVAHFVLFGIQASLLVVAINPRCDCTLRPVGAALVCAVYGVLMEIMQTHLPARERTFSWGDIAADAAGALVFAIVVARLLHGEPGSAGRAGCCSGGNE